MESFTIGKTQSHTFSNEDDSNITLFFKMTDNLLRFLLYRIDENSAKETKQSIFLVDQNEDEDDHEMNDGEVERLTKSSSASCSCTPPREENTQIMISQV